MIDREYHYPCGLTVVKHIPAYYNALLWEAPLMYSKIILLELAHCGKRHQHVRSLLQVTTRGNN